MHIHSWEMIENAIILLCFPQWIHHIMGHDYSQWHIDQCPFSSLLQYFIFLHWSGHSSVKRHFMLQLVSNMQPMILHGFPIHISWDTVIEWIWRWLKMCFGQWWMFFFFFGFYRLVNYKLFLSYKLVHQLLVDGKDLCPNPLKQFLKIKKCSSVNKQSSQM